MLIEKNFKTIDGSYTFLKGCKNEEIKSVFADVLKDFKQDESSSDKFYEQVNEFLNAENNWSDEEIISEVLKKRKGNYIVNFIDDSDGGYFQIFEVK